MPESRSLQNRVNAHLSWANTRDRTARTANARTAFQQKFLDEAGGDPQRAKSARKAYYLRLAQKSSKARKAHKAGAA
jgi:hypothetical protein